MKCFRKNSLASANGSLGILSGIRWSGWADQPVPERSDIYQNLDAIIKKYKRE